GARGTPRAAAIQVEPGCMCRRAPAEPLLDPIDSPLHVGPAAGAEQRELLGAGPYEPAPLHAQQTDAASRPGERPIELADNLVQVGADIGRIADGARPGGAWEVGQGRL